MDRSLGFGSTAWYSLFALLRLGFPSAPFLTKNLTSHHTSNSPDRSTKSTTSHLNVLCLLVNIGFQVLFHSPPGVLFNFPSRYCFTIGHQGVFSLTGWSPLLPTGFLVSCRTLDSTRLALDFVYETFTLFGMLFQYISTILHKWLIVVLNPENITTFGLGSSAFARHYLQNRFFFLLLWVLRCFSSPRLASIYYLIHIWISVFYYWQVSPFGYSWLFTDICSSSWLFAAYHVLLRLLMPRHSPYALISLTYFFRFQTVIVFRENTWFILYIFQCAMNVL